MMQIACLFTSLLAGRQCTVLRQAVCKLYSTSAATRPTFSGKAPEGREHLDDSAGVQQVTAEYEVVCA